MRLLCISAVLALLSTGAATAESAKPLDLSGSWVFTWDKDQANQNAAEVKVSGGTFTGSYVNDSKERCPVAGRMSSRTTISLTIVCPQWEIKADGSVVDARAIEGSYTAYGNSNGTFRMSRK